MNRIWIWEWGTKNIFDNPLFGIGFNDWERLHWMTNSVDMFWLLGGMRHGLLVWILYFAAFFLITVRVARLRGLSLRLHEYRMGYVVTMCGFFVCGWMVHFWNQTLSIFMFTLASGVWMLDYKEEKQAEGRPETRASGKRRTIL
jgi:hypothetical protein